MKGSRLRCRRRKARAHTVRRRVQSYSPQADLDPIDTETNDPEESANHSPDVPSVLQPRRRLSAATDKPDRKLDL